MTLPIRRLCVLLLASLVGSFVAARCAAGEPDHDLSGEWKAWLSPDFRSATLYRPGAYRTQDGKHLYEGRFTLANGDELPFRAIFDDESLTGTAIVDRVEMPFDLRFRKAPERELSGRFGLDGTIFLELRPSTPPLNARRDDPIGPTNGTANPAVVDARGSAALIPGVAANRRNDPDFSYTLDDVPANDFVPPRRSPVTPRGDSLAAASDPEFDFVLGDIPTEGDRAEASRTADAASHATAADVASSRRCSHCDDSRRLEIGPCPVCWGNKHLRRFCRVCSKSGKSYVPCPYCRDPFPAVPDWGKLALPKTGVPSVDAPAAPKFRFGSVLPSVWVQSDWELDGRIRSMLNALQGENLEAFGEGIRILRDAFLLPRDKWNQFTDWWRDKVLGGDAKQHGERLALYQAFKERMYAEGYSDAQAEYLWPAFWNWHCDSYDSIVYRAPEKISPALSEAQKRSLQRETGRALGDLIFATLLAGEPLPTRLKVESIDAPGTILERRHTAETFDWEHPSVQAALEQAYQRYFAESHPLLPPLATETASPMYLVQRGVDGPTDPGDPNVAMNDIDFRDASVSGPSASYGDSDVVTPSTSDRSPVVGPRPTDGGVGSGSAGADDDFANDSTEFGGRGGSQAGGNAGSPYAGDGTNRRFDSKSSPRDKYMSDAEAWLLHRPESNDDWYYRLGGIPHIRREADKMFASASQGQRERILRAYETVALEDWKTLLRSATFRTALSDVGDVVADAAMDAALEFLKKAINRGGNTPVGWASRLMTLGWDALREDQKLELADVQKHDPRARSVDDAWHGTPSIQAMKLAEKGYTVWQYPNGNWYYVASRDYVPEGPYSARFYWTAADPQGRDTVTTTADGSLKRDRTGNRRPPERAENHLLVAMRNAVVGQAKEELIDSVSKGDPKTRLPALTYLEFEELLQQRVEAENPGSERMTDERVSPARPLAGPENLATAQEFAATRGGTCWLGEDGKWYVHPDETYEVRSPAALIVTPGGVREGGESFVTPADPSADQPLDENRLLFLRALLRASLRYALESALSGP